MTKKQKAARSRAKFICDLATKGKTVTDWCQEFEAQVKEGIERSKQPAVKSP